MKQHRNHIQLYRDHFGISENQPWRLVHDAMGDVKPITIDCLETALKYNEYGYGMFFMPQQMINVRGRWDETNIGKMHTLYIDVDDGKPIPNQWFENFEPTMICKRRNANKWHAYWRLQPTSKIDDWRSIEKCLVSYYGGDCGVKNSNRIMRVPGTIHAKNSNSLDCYDIIELNDWHYTLDEASSVFSNHLQQLEVEEVARKERSEKVAKEMINTIDDFNKQELLEWMISKLNRIDTRKRNDARHPIILNFLGGCHYLGVDLETVKPFIIDWLVANGKTPSFSRNEVNSAADHVRSEPKRLGTFLEGIEIL